MAQCDGRICILLDKKSDNDTFWSNIIKKVAKVSEYDFESCFSYRKDGYCTIYEIAISYDEMKQVVDAIFSIVKKKGIVIADFTELNSDPANYCFYALGNEVKSAFVNNDMHNEVDIGSIDDWLQFDNSITIEADEVKFVKEIAGLKVKENAIIYDPIVVENVEAFTYKRKNTIISIKGQPGSDCLLGYGAFQDCKKLKKADFSECNTLFVDHDVFSGCYDLEEVKFPQNATIREEFSGCSKLFDNGFLISDRTLYRYNGNEENVEIPDGIKRIYDGAFFENGTLKTIKIPNTLTHTEKDSKA